MCTQHHAWVSHLPYSAYKTHGVHAHVRFNTRQVEYASAPIEAQYLERSWYHIFSCEDHSLHNAPPPPSSSPCSADYATSTACCGFGKPAEDAQMLKSAGWEPGEVGWKPAQCPEQRPVCIGYISFERYGRCYTRDEAFRRRAWIIP